MECLCLGIGHPQRPDGRSPCGSFIASIASFAFQSPSSCNLSELLSARLLYESCGSSGREGGRQHRLVLRGNRAPDRLRLWARARRRQGISLKGL